MSQRELFVEILSDQTPFQDACYNADLTIYKSLFVKLETLTRSLEFEKSELLKPLKNYTQMLKSGSLRGAQDLRINLLHAIEKPVGGSNPAT